MDFDNDGTPIRGRRRDPARMKYAGSGFLNGMGDYAFSAAADPSAVPHGVYQVGERRDTSGRVIETIWSDGSVRNADGSLRHPAQEAPDVSIVDSFRESVGESLQRGAQLANVGGKWIIAGIVVLALVEVWRATRR